MRTSNHKKLIIPLLIIMIGMIVAHLVLQFRMYALGLDSSIVLGSTNIDLAYWFNLNHEERFGAMFGALLILTASTLMACAAYRAMPDKKWLALGWLLFACILAFMACDEYFSIHEKAGAYAGLQSKGYGSQIMPNWVKVMAVVVGLLCIPMGFFWWMLPRGVRIRTAIAAAVFLGGAMGVEVISSAFVMHQGNENFGYYILVAIEEGMEMLGMFIVIDTMLLHLMGVRQKSGLTEPVNTTESTTQAASL